MQLCSNRQPQVFLVITIMKYVWQVFGFDMTPSQGAFDTFDMTPGTFLSQCFFVFFYKNNLSLPMTGDDPKQVFWYQFYLHQNKPDLDITTVFLYCYPDCPLYLNNMGWVTWAIWTSTRKFSLLHIWMPIGAPNCVHILAPLYHWQGCH